MAKKATAKVKISGAREGAWIRGTFKAGKKESPGKPVKLSKDGTATLTARIEATTALEFTVTSITRDEAGKQPYVLTGQRTQTLAIANVTDIVLSYK